MDINEKPTTVKPVKSSFGFLDRILCSTFLEGGNRGYVASAIKEVRSTLDRAGTECTPTALKCLEDLDLWVSAETDGAAHGLYQGLEAEITHPDFIEKTDSVGFLISAVWQIIDADSDPSPETMALDASKLCSRWEASR